MRTVVCFNLILKIDSKHVRLNPLHCDINIFPATSTSRKPCMCSVQIPLKLNLSSQTPARYGEICIQSSHEGWTSKADNRISCCFITLSLNQCHHMLLLAQGSLRGGCLGGRLRPVGSQNCDSVFFFPQQLSPAFVLLILQNKTSQNLDSKTQDGCIVIFCVIFAAGQYSTLKLFCIFLSFSAEGIFYAAYK